VLGADDGIVSVASVSIGVIATGSSHQAVMTAAIASLVAGGMSMAAGEYVSVSSQGDVARADLDEERRELRNDPVGETSELAGIYRRRGVPGELAEQVATALMAHDPMAAHARDELGLTEESRARPVQAALSSAASFALGGMLPLLALVLSPVHLRVALLIVASILALSLLGVSAARAGGAPVGRAALRVALGGTAAISITALVGQLFGVATS
jgi:VIT1/CCC1 family predicted Fe2+/Mn2+ transporter